MIAISPPTWITSISTRSSTVSWRTRRIGRIRRFVGALMADCIPTGGEAAVINRKKQASGFEIHAWGEAEGSGSDWRTGGSNDDVKAECAYAFPALRLLITSRSIGDHSNANPAFQSGAASIGLRAFNASSVYPITPFQ